MKNAIVTGASGQDGSIISEQLIDDGYKVYALYRRRSDSPNLGCAVGLVDNPNFEVVEGDITDLSSLVRLTSLVSADRFFHLASMSHVGTSFKEPIHTAQATGVATLNCLEAIRISGVHTRFYNAATSELFGGITSGPCNEDSLVCPKSPYACAKAFGYYITQNYRESYKMFASSGLLFNHECFYSDTPVILRKNGEIQVDYVRNLIQNRTDVSKDTTEAIRNYCGSGVEIWDGHSFVELKTISRKKLSALHSVDRDKQITNARCGSVSTTPNHKLIDEFGEKREARTFEKGQMVSEGSMPKGVQIKAVLPQFAELLGLLAGDGYVSNNSVCLTSNDVAIRTRFRRLCQSLFTDVHFVEAVGQSGFGGTSTYIEIRGLGQDYCRYLRGLLYDKRTKNKKVPVLILNSGTLAKRKFLEGYNLADGLKKDKTTYQFKSFKTNSPLLAQGVLYLVRNVTDQTWCINTFEQNERIYYQVNLRSDRSDVGNSGRHLKKPSDQVSKIINCNVPDQHVFDIETATGRVMAGVGTMVVGNSSRRGPNFVTRKISMAVANIKAGNQQNLYLGNLDAKRDWGWAEDFCTGMRMILDYNEPGDFVLGTGETHSVRDFCRIAFEYAGLNYEDYVKIDPRFFRPCEVDVLLADYSKAERDLGWRPTVKFKELVQKMVDYDVGLLEVR